MKLIQELLSLTESTAAVKYSRADAAKDMHDDFGGRLSLEDCKIIVDAIEDNDDIPDDLRSTLAYAYSDRHSTHGRESIEHIMDMLAQDYAVNESAPSANRNLAKEVADKFGTDAKMSDAIVAWLENGDDPEVEEFLMDYFMDNGEMPYGVAKARTGDPHNWIADKMQSMFSESLKEDWGSSDWTAVFNSIESQMKRGGTADEAVRDAAEFYGKDMGYDDIEDAIASIKRVAKARKWGWAMKD